MKLRSWLWDLIALSGLGCLLAGLWILHPSLSLILGGLLLTGAGVVGAKTWG